MYVLPPLTQDIFQARSIAADLCVSKYMTGGTVSSFLGMFMVNEVIR